MADIFHLPNPQLSRMSPEEALMLIRQRRANRRSSKAAKYKRPVVSVPVARAKRTSASGLAKKLTKKQAQELLATLGEDIFGEPL